MGQARAECRHLCHSRPAACRQVDQLAPTPPLTLAGINVAGRGAVEAMPDQATVSLSVSSTKPQSADARDAAAAAASAVLAALSALGPSVNTTTTGVSVYQQTQLIDNSYVPVG